VSVVLIGPRRAGKSVVGAALAARLRLPFFDLDAFIEARTGRSPSTWILEDGVEAFRRAEADAAFAATEEGDKVLATGGGTPLKPAVAARLKAAGPVLYLRVGPHRLVERMAEESAAIAATRPMLVDAPPFVEPFVHFAERDATYFAVADGVVDADAAVAVVVERCVRRLSDLGGAAS
jgi:shikimate kinase